MRQVLNLATLVAMLISGGFAQSKLAQPRKINLAAFGHPGYDLQPNLSRRHRSSQVTYLDDRTIVASFLTRASSSRLSRRGFPENHRLKAVFLNRDGLATSGSLSWPVHPDSARLFTGDGFLVLQSGDVVRINDRRGAMLREFVPFGGSEDFRGWDLRLSPSKKTLWMQHWSDARRLARISLEDFSSVEMHLPADAVHWAPLDRHVIVSGGQASQVSILETRTTSPTHMRIGFCPVAKQVATISAAILLASGCGTAAFTDLKGRALMPDVLTARESYLQHTTSETGDVVALLVKAVHRRLRRTSRGRLKLFSISSRRLLAIVDPPSKPHYGFDFALSPDGRQLAVLVDAHLFLYRLPVEPAATRLAEVRAAFTAR